VAKTLRPCDNKLVEFEKKLTFWTENESLGWKIKIWDGKSFCGI